MQCIALHASMNNINCHSFSFQCRFCTCSWFEHNHAEILPSLMCVYVLFVFISATNNCKCNYFDHYRSHVSLHLFGLVFRWQEMVMLAKICTCKLYMQTQNQYSYTHSQTHIWPKRLFAHLQHPRIEPWKCVCHLCMFGTYPFIMCYMTIQYIVQDILSHKTHKYRSVSVCINSHNLSIITQYIHGYFFFLLL